MSDALTSNHDALVAQINALPEPLRPAWRRQQPMNDRTADTKVIHNGDHLEFELAHANTPPQERPDWPMPSFDALEWAKAFNKRHPGISVDDALPWMAAALMRGYDEHAARMEHDSE